MSEPSDLDRARRAKQTLQEKYQQAPWFRGIGIAPSDRGFAVRLNVDAAAVQPEELPSEWEGIPVEIVRIRGYTARDH